MRPEQGLPEQGLDVPNETNPSGGFVHSNKVDSNQSLTRDCAPPADDVTDSNSGTSRNRAGNGDIVDRAQRPSTGHVRFINWISDCDHATTSRALAELNAPRDSAPATFRGSTDPNAAATPDMRVDSTQSVDASTQSVDVASTKGVEVAARKGLRLSNKRNRLLPGGAFRETLSQRIKGTLRRPRNENGQLDQGFSVRQGLYGGSVAWNDLRYRYGAPANTAQAALLGKTDVADVADRSKQHGQNTTGERSVRRKSATVHARELARIEAAPALGSRQHHPFEVYQLELPLPEPPKFEPARTVHRRNGPANTSKNFGRSCTYVEPPYVRSESVRRPDRAQAKARGKNWHRSQRLLQHASWGMIFTALLIFGLVLFDEPKVVRSSVEVTSARDSLVSLAGDSKNITTKGALTKALKTDTSSNTSVSTITPIDSRAIVATVSTSSYTFPVYQSLEKIGVDHGIPRNTVSNELLAPTNGVGAGWFGIGVFGLGLTSTPSHKTNDQTNASKNSTTTHSTSLGSPNESRSPSRSRKDDRKAMKDVVSGDKSLKSADTIPRRSQSRSLASDRHLRGFNDPRVSRNGGAVTRPINFIGVADAYGLSSIVFAVTDGNQGLVNTQPMLMQYDVSTHDIFSFIDPYAYPPPLIAKATPSSWWRTPMPNLDRPVSGKLNSIAADTTVTRDYLR